MIDYKECERSSGVTLELTNMLKEDIKNGKTSFLVVRNDVERRIAKRHYKLDDKYILTTTEVYFEEAFCGYNIDTVYFDDFRPYAERLSYILELDKRNINCVIRVQDPAWFGGVIESHRPFFEHMKIFYPEMLI